LGFSSLFGGLTGRSWRHFSQEMCAKQLMSTAKKCLIYSTVRRAVQFDNSASV
jgi:hypothetical protein